MPFRKPVHASFFLKMFQIPMWNSALLVFGDYKVVTKLTIVYLSTIQ